MYRAGVSSYIDKMDLSGMISYLDCWDAQTNHHAALYENNNEEQNDMTWNLNCDAAIQAYFDAKVPSEKIVMSITLFTGGLHGEWPLSFSRSFYKENALNEYLQLTSSQISNGIWVSYENL